MAASKDMRIHVTLTPDHQRILRGIVQHLSAKKKEGVSAVSAPEAIRESILIAGAKLGITLTALALAFFTFALPACGGAEFTSADAPTGDPMEAGTTADRNTLPPADAISPLDTDGGTVEPDSGTVEPDAGSTNKDAETSKPDAHSEASDAVAPVEASSPPEDAGGTKTPDAGSSGCKTFVPGTSNVCAVCENPADFLCVNPYGPGTGTVCLAVCP